MTQDTQQPTMDRADDAMGVTLTGRGAEGAVYQQQLGGRFADHRGEVPLGAVGVLLETAVAGAVYESLPPGSRSLASSLSVSAARPLPLDGTVCTEGRLLHFDPELGVGVASGELRDTGGNVFATATARGVVVTRKADPSVLDAPAGLAGTGAEVDAPRPHPTEMSGLDVVRGIALGELKSGPLAEMLAVELRVVELGRVTGAFSPQPWMSNQVGSVQGGVVFAVADLLSGLAAQTVTDPGERYRVLDLRTDFVRSPDLEGPDIHLEAEVVRVGRRLELVESRLVGASGKLMARSFATVHRR